MCSVYIRRVERVGITVCIVSAIYNIKGDRYEIFTDTISSSMGRGEVSEGKMVFILDEEKKVEG